MTSAPRPQDIRRIQQLLCEVRKPFIQILVDIYSVGLPTIIVRDNAVIDIVYPDWVKEQEATIRTQMAEAEDLLLRNLEITDAKS